MTSSRRNYLRTIRKLTAEELTIVSCNRYDRDGDSFDFDSPSPRRED